MMRVKTDYMSRTMIFTKLLQNYCKITCNHAFLLNVFDAFPVVWDVLQQLVLMYEQLDSGVACTQTYSSFRSILVVVKLKWLALHGVLIWVVKLKWFPPGMHMFFGEYMHVSVFLLYIV